MGSDEQAEKLPLTTYATLGLLTPSEEFTAVEIQARAQNLLRYFYWTPALSHIRRELNRLEEFGLVEVREARQSRVRRTLKYRISEAGSEVLRTWVETSTIDPVVTKNPAILRVWLGRRAGDGTLVLAALRAHLNAVRADLADLRANVDRVDAVIAARADSIGKAGAPPGRDLPVLVSRPMWSNAVFRYCLRSLEFDAANLEQLHEELAALVGPRYAEDPGA